MHEHHHLKKWYVFFVLFMTILLGYAAFTLDSSSSITGYVIADQPATYFKSIQQTYTEEKEDIPVVFGHQATTLRVTGEVQNGDAQIFFKTVMGETYLLVDTTDIIENIEDKKTFLNLCKETCDLETPEKEGDLLIYLFPSPGKNNVKLILEGITYTTEQEPKPELKWLSEKEHFLIQEATELKLSLNDYVGYEDPRIEQDITFLATASATVDIDLINDQVTITPKQGFTGTETITIIASDAYNEPLRKEITVTVQGDITEEDLLLANSPAEIDEEIKERFDVGYPTTDVIITFRETDREVLAEQNEQLYLAEKRIEVNEMTERFDERYLTKQQMESFDPTYIPESYDHEVDVKHKGKAKAIITGTLTEKGLTAILKDPKIASVQVDRTFGIALTDTINITGANLAHTTTIQGIPLTGEGHAVCILDTGADLLHEAYTERIIGGYDFVNNDLIPEDDNLQSHGTHMTGIIGAEPTGESNLTGVAPSADLVIVKVCNSLGECQMSDIMAGIDYCVNNKDIFNIDVITGSFGDNQEWNSSSCPMYFDDLLTTAEKVGITTVFSTGNQAFNEGINYPACQETTIAVGATTKENQLTAFTNVGGATDLLAPGQNVLSTTIGNTYNIASGTSVSTPHVAAAALLLYQHEALQERATSPGIIKQVLRESGNKDGLAYPIMDVYQALQNISSGKYTIEAPVYSINESLSKVANAHGAIQFTQPTFMQGIEACIVIKHNHVELDAELCPEYSREAVITIFNVPYTDNVQILKDDLLCSTEVCTNSSYHNGTMTFVVPGFSKYAITGDLPEETNGIFVGVPMFQVATSKGKEVNAELEELENNDLKLTVHETPVEEIVFKKLERGNGLDIGIEKIPSEKLPKTIIGERAQQSYAIDPTQVDFESATVTVTAAGNMLYKCKAWNFSTQTCGGDWQLFKTNLVPGETYTFTLTPDDPGFIEILITKAEHLDDQRLFISDIYGEVKEKDGVWSETIHANEYVRVTFEKALSAENDITLFPRKVSGTPIIEVYEKEGAGVIATFAGIQDDVYNKVYLTSLNGSQDTFDLKIVGGSMEFDHIIDPTDISNVAQIYQIGVTQDADTEISIEFNQQTVVQSNYSHDTVTNNHLLTFNQDGLFKVSYGCGFQELGNGGGSREIMTTWLEDDGGAEIVPSRAYCYLRDTEDDMDRCSTAAVTLVNMSAGEDITLQADRQQGTAENADPEESCWIYAEKVNRPVAQIYETTDHDATLDPSTHITQDFGATTIEDAGNFTVDLTNNWIQVDQDGWYKIYYVASSQQTSGSSDNDRSTPATYLYLNDATEIEPSMTYSYHKRSDQAAYSTEEGFTFANLNAGDNVSMRRFLSQRQQASAVTQTLSDSWLLMEQISGDDILLLWDRSGGQAALSGGSYVEGDHENITWNGQEQVGANFSHSLGDANFTIASDGWFEISYAVSFDAPTSSNRKISCARVIQNGVPLEPSEQCEYERDSSNIDENSVAANFLVNNTAGDEYHVQHYVTGDNAADGHLLIAGSSWVSVMPVAFEVEDAPPSDTTPPNVTDLRPVNNTIYNISTAIEIAANVTDDSGVSLVRANITYPNGTVETLDLVYAAGTKYHYPFNIPALTGTYNVSFWANDTSNNINNSEFTNFTAVTPPLDCGQTITGNTNITTPLTASGTCFEVTAPAIITCQDGGNLTGDGAGNGFDIQATSNVTIRDCAMSSFAIGVLASSSTNIQIINNTIFNHSNGGVRFTSTNYSFILNNTIHSGIAAKFPSDTYLFGTEHNLVQGNVIDTNYIAGFFQTGHNNSFVGNNVSASVFSIGFYSDAAQEMNITGNTINISAASAYAMYLFNSWGSMRGNEISIDGSGVFGTYISGGGPIQVSNNQVAAYGGGAFSFYLNGDGNLVEYNNFTAEGAGTYGMYGVIAENNLFIENNVNVTGTNAFGLTEVFSTNNTYERNRISAPEGYEVSIDSGSVIYLRDIILGGVVNFSSTHLSGVNIRVNESPVADPSGIINLSDYLTISGFGYVDFNVSYDDSEITEIDEDSLRFYRYNGTGYEVVVNSSVDTANNIISSGNITSSFFGDIGSFGNSSSVAIALSLSNSLSGNINWTVVSVPATNLSANGNNASGITEYDVEVSVSGTTVDMYIKASGNLSTGGGEQLGLENEKFSYNISDSTVPADIKFNLTANYSDNQIGDNLVNGSRVYLKFFLDVPPGQAPGTYGNNVSIVGVEDGATP